VSATFKNDVYKRSPMTELTTGQMFALTYRVLVSGSSKVNLSRISDYDMFLNFSINSPEWKEALKAKLISGYNSAQAPDLADEILQIANAPKGDVRSKQVQSHLQEQPQPLMSENDVFKRFEKYGDKPADAFDMDNPDSDWAVKSRLYTQMSTSMKVK
jgi:hypothetical protein